MAKRKSTRHTGSAKLGGEKADKVSALGGAFIVRPGKDRFNPHRTHWRELEFAQIAIGNLFPDGPPPHVNLRALRDKVNKWLDKYPKWRETGYGRNGKVSRPTVNEALTIYREANR